jgi:hypothetical protein
VTEPGQPKKPAEETHQRPATEEEIVRAEAVGSRFEVDVQRAETINNIGGDQSLYLPERKSRWRFWRRWHRRERK